MKKMLVSILMFIIILLNLGGICFGNALESEIDDSVSQIQEHVEVMTTNTGGLGEGAKDFMIDIGQKIMIPAGILIGLIVAIIGFFNMMISEKEEEQKKGTSFLIWGVIGIIIMMLAYFITIKLVGYSGTSGDILDFDNLDGIQVAETLYSNFFFPILRIITYLIVGILFIILLIHAIKLAFSPGEDLEKKSRTIIIWNIIGILVILFAKNIVELIYGDEGSLLGGSTLEPGQAILENASDKFSFLHTIINWIMGFVAFIILVIIIYQSLLLVVKPDDAETTKKMGRNIVYVFIGILIIGAGYLITNFFIVKA